MKHETKLAAALSDSPDLTAHFRDNYSADELADLLLEKTSAGALGALFARGVNWVGPQVARAAKAVTSGTMTPGQMGGAGAALGAGAGAVRHMMKSRDPRTGQRPGSLLGSMTGGAVLGGVGGLAAPTIGKAVLQSKNPGVQSAMRGNYPPGSGVPKVTPKMLTPAVHGLD
jgi:hypothetical protein